MSTCSSGQVARYWPGLLILLWLSSTSALAQEADRIDRLTRQWLDTERQSSRLQSEWRDQQPVLFQRIALLKAERDQLQGILQESHSNQSDVDAQRSTLLDEQAHLEQQQLDVANSIAQLKSRLGAIKDQLPPPLSDAWAAEQTELGDNPDTSTQLQVALAQLSRVADFNQRISVNESPITTPDAREIQVKQLYLGVGMAWFTSADGQVAGWGQAGDEGWQWHFADGVDADAVNRAIAMFEKREQAEFVRLPVVLQPASLPEGVHP